MWPTLSTTLTITVINLLHPSLSPTPATRSQYLSGCVTVHILFVCVRRERWSVSAIPTAGYLSTLEKNDIIRRCYLHIETCAESLCSHYLLYVYADNYFASWKVKKQNELQNENDPRFLKDIHAASTAAVLCLPHVWCMTQKITRCTVIIFSKIIIVSNYRSNRSVETWLHQMTHTQRWCGPGLITHRAASLKSSLNSTVVLEQSDSHLGRWLNVPWRTGSGIIAKRTSLGATVTSDHVTLKRGSLSAEAESTMVSNALLAQSVHNTVCQETLPANVLQQRFSVQNKQINKKRYCVVASTSSFWCKRNIIISPSFIIALFITFFTAC